MKPLAIVGTILVVGILLSQCRSVPDSAPSSTAEAAPAPQKEKATWSYGEWHDKMTGNRGSYANLDSENTANLEFPYQGAQHAVLHVDDDGDVGIRVQRGQITCNDECRVLVKIDDNAPVYYTFRPLGDKSISIYSSDKTLTKRLYAAKLFTARLFFFQNDSVDFEFDVAGLQRVKKPEKPKA